MSARPLGLAVAFTLAVIGCVPSTPGELGAGQFTYECVDGAYDSVCADSFSDQSNVPAKVVVGAPFEVVFWSSDSTEPGQSVVISASPAILADQGSTYEFASPGFAAILAREPSGTVVDFLHVRGVPLDHLTLYAEGKPAPSIIDMEVGHSLAFTVEPMDDAESILAGAIDFTWSVSADTAVVQPNDFSLNGATLVANAPGTIQLNVTAAGKAATVQINVGDQP